MRIFVYYFIGIITSILLGIFLMVNNFLMFMFVLTVLIIFINVIRVGFRLKISVIVMSFMAFINIIYYYSVQDNVIYNEDFRIIKKMSGDVILSSGGILSKRYLIRNFKEIDDVNIGQLLNISGSATRKSYYDIGVNLEFDNYRLNGIREDLYYGINYFKDKIRDVFIRNFGSDRGGILTALSLGDTSYLDRDYKNDLNRLGISHILSVSGFHINLIFSMVYSLLSLMPSMFITFLYLIITGVKVSGIRAFSMLFIKEMAPRVYKTYDGLNAMCLVGSIILLFRPYEIFNLGFIYSFSATAGILMFNKRIKDSLYRLPKLLADPIALTLSAQVFIFPIIVLVNKKLELGFLLSNILLVPFYSILIILSVIFVCINFIPFVSDIILYLIILIFDIIDGGLILVKYIIPDDIYLLNSMIIFIICVYIMFCVRRYITRKMFNNISIVLMCLYLGVSLISTSIEMGNYFGSNYVIIRNFDRSFLYLSGRIKNTEYLIDKLGVDRVLTDIDRKDVLFNNIKIGIDFEGEDTILNIGRTRISDSIGENKFKYYYDIQPKRYYMVF